MPEYDKTLCVPKFRWLEPRRGVFLFCLMLLLRDILHFGTPCTAALRCPAPGPDALGTYGLRHLWLAGRVRLLFKILRGTACY